MSEDFVDCCGEPHRFIITVRDLGYSFVVEAQEQSDHRLGYRFKVISESDPFQGLGQLRKTIRKALSKRFINREQGGALALSHDELEGRISNDGLVVDGQLLTWLELQEQLCIHEGFEISIKIL
jgi:hypothetical protein